MPAYNARLIGFCNSYAGELGGENAFVVERAGKFAGSAAIAPLRVS